MGSRRKAGAGARCELSAHAAFTGNGRRSKVRAGSVRARRTGAEAGRKALDAIIARSYDGRGKERAHTRSHSCYHVADTLPRA